MNREVNGTQPVAVQYALTDKGRQLGQLLSGFQVVESDPTLFDMQS